MAALGPACLPACLRRRGAALSAAKHAGSRELLSCYEDKAKEECLLGWGQHRGAWKATALDPRELDAIRVIIPTPQSFLSQEDARWEPEVSLG